MNRYVYIWSHVIDDLQIPWIPRIASLHGDGEIPTSTFLRDGWPTYVLTGDDHPRVAISRRRPLSGNCFRALTPCLPTSNGPSFSGPSGNVLRKGRALLLTVDMKEIIKSLTLLPKRVHHLFQHCSDPSQMVSEVIEFFLKLKHPCRP